MWNQNPKPKLPPTEGDTFQVRIPRYDSPLIECAQILVEEFMGHLIEDRKVVEVDFPEPLQVIITFDDGTKAEVMGLAAQKLKTIAKETARNLPRPRTLTFIERWL